MPDYAIQPQDWVRTSPVVQDDETKLFGVKCVGTKVWGIVSTSATIASALKFEQGATSTLAAGTTGDNPGTNGVLSTIGRDYHAMVRAINAANDWEAWLESALPADGMHTGGTSHYVVVADQDAKVAGGYVVLGDSSVSMYLAVGFTLNGPSSEPHGHDAQVLHELLQLKANIGSTLASPTLKVYACDDVAGSSSEILEVTAPGSVNTERLYPTDSGIGEPIQSVKTKRLVVKLATGTLLQDVDNKLGALGRSYIYGPGLRKSKLWQKQ